MKAHMRLSIPSCSILVLVVIYGCSDAVAPNAVPRTVGLTVDPHQALIYLGSQRQFAATVQGSAGGELTSVTVTWSTSDSAILAVSADGMVTALAVGQATIRASADGYADSAQATVSLVPIRAITIVSSSTRAGDTLQLVATVEDSSGNPLLGRSVQWSTADPNVTVSPTGLLTTLRSGTVTVIAEAEGLEAWRAIPIESGVFNQVGIGPGGESCGIIGNAGVAYCWGAIPLGWGMVSAVPVPTQASQVFSSVYPSFYGACALAAGTAFCWGTEYSNSFGSGQFHPDGHEVLVPTAVAGQHDFSQLSVRLRLTCGVTIQQAGYCWGAHPDGGIGNGDTFAVAPALLPGNISWQSISTAIAGHSCGVSTTGLAYCWGTNRYGELGTGDTLPSAYPVPVMGGLHFRSISVGSNFTCAVTTSSEGYCWGDRGFLATGPKLGTTAPYEYCDAIMTYACNTQPVPVAGGLAFTSIESGQYFACGLTASDTVYCWGSNWLGQLGRLSPPDQCGEATSGFYPCNQTPRPIESPLTFNVISVGSDHVCGISAGRAYCWGQSVGGELGDPSLAYNSFSATPVMVVSP